MQQKLYHPQCLLIADLAQKLLSSHLPAAVDSLHVTPSRDSNKLQTELAERTAEISRLRDQMSQQQTELEQVRSKLKSHEGLKDSLDAASHELVGNLTSSYQLIDQLTNSKFIGIIQSHLLFFFLSKINTFSVR